MVTVESGVLDTFVRILMTWILRVFTDLFSV